MRSATTTEPAEDSAVSARIVGVISETDENRRILAPSQSSMDGMCSGCDYGCQSEQRRSSKHSK